MPEFFESPDEFAELPVELWDPPSFFETPLLTMPISLTSTADPAFYYFEFVVIGLGCIFYGLPPNIVL